jgi:hypothetical protein
MNTLVRNLKWLRSEMAIQYGRILLGVYVLATLVFLYTHLA